MSQRLHRLSRADQPLEHGVQLVDAKRAAELLAVSARTLWTLTNRGEIPHVRFGRSVRYDLADLRAWVEARKVGGRYG